MDDEDTQSPVSRTPPTPSSVVVSLLLVVAAIATMALFAVPLQNRWFWPTAGVLALSAGLALAIPLKRKS